MALLFVIVDDDDGDNDDDGGGDDFLKGMLGLKLEDWVQKTESWWFPDGRTTDLWIGQLQFRVLSFTDHQALLCLLFGTSCALIL